MRIGDKVGSVRVVSLVAVSDPAVAAAIVGLTAFLRDCGWEAVDHDVARLPAEQWAALPHPGDLALVCTDRPLGEPEAERVVESATRSRWLLLGPTLHAWRTSPAVLEMVGVFPGALHPAHETRLRAGPDGGELVARLDDLVLTDRWPAIDKTAGDVSVFVTANVGLVDHPVVTLRGGHGVCALGSLPATCADPRYHRLVHRWLRAAAGLGDGPPVRVGLLGFGAIGVEHLLGIERTPGLTPRAVADRAPDRLAVVTGMAPGVSTYADGPALLDDDDIDLVVVSTPPSSHAEWARRALDAGKHVIVEKPMCLTTAEADEMIAAAADRGRTLVVYQNRRFDPDFLAIRRAVRSGMIGDVFDYRSFVGGFGHPCNYWHSDERVSGGALYDWGAHYLDWLLDLLPQEIEQVTASAHKRVWYDVTNADHTRVTVRFVDGVEAEFVHSDIAAARPPKWQVLGTTGALVGEWQAPALVSRDPAGALLLEVPPVADAPARVVLHGGDGAVTVLPPVVVSPAPFHRELADWLLAGVPMSVRAEQARRVVAVLEAATRSASSGGAPVRPR